MDSRVHDVPETMKGRLTASTGSCVAIGTLSEADGPTTVRLVASSEVLDAGAGAALTKAWEGVIATPTGELVVASVTGDIYASWPVGERTGLRVLANNAKEPDEIWLIVEELRPGV